MTLRRLRVLIAGLPPTSALWQEVLAERERAEEERRERKLTDREQHYRDR